MGLAIVLWACFAHVRDRPVRHHHGPRVLPAWVLPSVLSGAALAGCAAALAHLEDGIHAIAFHGVVTGIQAGVVGLAVTCTVWLVRRGN